MLSDILTTLAEVINKVTNDAGDISRDNKKDKLLYKNVHVETIYMHFGIHFHEISNCCKLEHMTINALNCSVKISDVN